MIVFSCWENSSHGLRLSMEKVLSSLLDACELVLMSISCRSGVHTVSPPIAALCGIPHHFELRQGCTSVPQVLYVGRYRYPYFTNGSSTGTEKVHQANCRVRSSGLGSPESRHGTLATPSPLLLPGSHRAFPAQQQTAPDTRWWKLSILLRQGAWALSGKASACR